VRAGRGGARNKGNWKKARTRRTPKSGKIGEAGIKIAYPVTKIPLQESWVKRKKQKKRAKGVENKEGKDTKKGAKTGRGGGHQISPIPKRQTAFEEKKDPTEKCKEQPKKKKNR